MSLVLKYKIENSDLDRCKFQIAQLLKYYIKQYASEMTQERKSENGRQRPNFLHRSVF